MESINTTPTQNYLTRNGFVMVSNLLIEYQQELGITDLEFNFIIKIMKNKPGYYIHDSDLDPNVCSKTLQRRRASLKNKGYLKYSIIKEQNPETNTFVTKGICYDLSPLEDKLQKLSNKLEEKNVAKIKKEIKEQKLIVEEDENSPLSDYKKDYENYYGIPYVLNDYEINKYNSLSEENKKIFSYIFLYCKEKKLLNTIVPRLSLFFKTNFRFLDLRKFCIQNGYIQENEFKSVVELKEEEEQNKKEEERENEMKEMDKLSENIYDKYYSSRKINPFFLKAIKRIVLRHYFNGELSKSANILINKAYEDNKKYEVKNEI